MTPQPDVRPSAPDPTVGSFACTRNPAAVRSDTYRPLGVPYGVRKTR